MIFLRLAGFSEIGSQRSEIRASELMIRVTIKLSGSGHCFITIFLRLVNFFQLSLKYVCPAFSVPGSRSGVQRTPRLNTLEGDPSEIEKKKALHGVNPVQPQYHLPELPQYHLPELRGRRGRRGRQRTQSDYFFFC